MWVIMLPVLAFPLDDELLRRRTLSSFCPQHLPLGSVSAKQAFNEQMVGRLEGRCDREDFSEEERLERSLIGRTRVSIRTEEAPRAPACLEPLVCGICDRMTPGTRHSSVPKLEPEPHPTLS